MDYMDSRHLHISGVKIVLATDLVPALLTVSTKKFKYILCMQEHIMQYSEQALDALAILMTAVKVLYLGGAIVRAAEAIRMIEPARSASCKPLHTTLIRNEAAYFSCISQLLKDYPPPPTLHTLDPLFLCGDSHILSGSLGR